jgi:hypothetical protein
MFLRLGTSAELKVQYTAPKKARYRHRPLLIFTFPCACSFEPAPRLTWTLEPQPSHGEGICEADAECPLIGSAAGLRDDR